eukprot:2209063-Prymnesium_polylepis.2
MTRKRLGDGESEALPLSAPLARQLQHETAAGVPADAASVVAVAHGVFGSVHQGHVVEDQRTVRGLSRLDSDAAHHLRRDGVHGVPHVAIGPLLGCYPSQAL